MRKSEWPSPVVDVALIVAARSFAVFKMKLLLGNVHSAYGTNVAPTMRASMGMDDEVVSARPSSQVSACVREAFAFPTTKWTPT